MKNYVLIAALVAVSTVLLPLDANAQPFRFYTGVLAGSHQESSDHASGRAASAGVVGGVWLTRSIAVEVEGSRPAHSFTREYEGFSVSFASPGATREEIERLAVFSRYTRQRTITSTLSVAIVHGTEFTRRWGSRLFAGVVSRRVEDRATTTPLRYPADVDLRQLAAVRPTDERVSTAVGALTLGGGVAFAATKHLTISPDWRVDVGIGDQKNNGTRTSVRVSWNF